MKTTPFWSTLYNNWSMYIAAVSDLQGVLKRLLTDNAWFGAHLVHVLQCHGHSVCTLSVTIIWITGTVKRKWPKSRPLPWILACICLLWNLSSTIIDVHEMHPELITPKIYLLFHTWFIMVVLYSFDNNQIVINGNDYHSMLHVQQLASGPPSRFAREKGRPDVHGNHNSDGFYLNGVFSGFFLDKQISTCCRCKFCCVCMTMCRLWWCCQISHERLI